MLNLWIWILLGSKLNQRLRYTAHWLLKENCISWANANARWTFCRKSVSVERRYYWPSRPFKFGSEFRSKEMKGRPLFLSFLKNLHETRSAFHFLGSEIRTKNEKPTMAIISHYAWFRSHFYAFRCFTLMMWRSDKFPI